MILWFVVPLPLAVLVGRAFAAAEGAEPIERRVTEMA